MFAINLLLQGVKMKYGKCKMIRDRKVLNRLIKYVKHVLKGHLILV